MNVVYNKSSLKVISVFDGGFSSENILRQMFPDQFKELGLWHINKRINHSLVCLSVKTDENNLPNVLLYKNKEVYRRSAEEKKVMVEKRIEEGRKNFSHLLPRNLRSSMGFDIVKLWMSSPYTHPSIVPRLKDFQYFSDKSIIPVTWWGNFVDAGGYGNMNRSILFRLHNYHVLPRAEIMPTLPQISQLGQYYVSKYASIDFKRLPRCHKVCGFGPHPHTRGYGKTIFFTMMETETLHPSFRDLCNQFSDEVWVPSSHNKEVFERGGINKPICLMPLGMDEIIYGNADSISAKDPSTIHFCDILGKPISQGLNSFRFFTLFGWSFRKGIDILIKSFVKAFNSKDDVSLVIFSNHVGPNIVVRDVLKYAREIRGSDYPQILFIPGVTPELEMPSLYKIGHAFLHTSRGEGFSLPQIEAAACGLPVISCNNTGMSEYLRDDNSFMITTEEKEICSPEMHWISGYYHGQLFPKLGKDQINQAVNHMHYVVNNYDKAIEKGKKLKKLVVDQYTWDKTAERVANRIREIS